MRLSFAFAAFAAAFAGLAALGFAQEKPPKLPWNPWEKAEAGDWASYEKKAWTAKDAPMDVDVELTEALDVADGRVVVSHRGHALPASATSLARIVSTKGRATIDDLLGELPRGQKVKGLKVADEKRPVGGRPFACQRLSFSIEVPKQEETIEMTVWLSKEVRAGGIVELDMRQGMEFATLRLAGHGTRAKVGFGKTFAAIAKPFLGTKGDHALFVNPFANAAAGDWLLLEHRRVPLDAQGRPDAARPAKVSACVVEVDAVDGDDVWVSTRPVPKPKGAWSQHCPPAPSSYAYSRSKAPGMAELLGVLNARGMLADEKLKLGEKEFECKCLSFEVTEAGVAWNVSAWISTDAKANGLLKAEVVPDRAKGIGYRLDVEAVGFGAKGTTLFGKSPEEEAKSVPAEEPDEKPGAGGK